MLEATLRPLLEVMETRLWKAMKKRYIESADLEVTLREHLCIVEAVEVRDGNSAARMMREHLQNSKARLLGGTEGG